jgi:hypothetical protein
VTPVFWSTGNIVAAVLNCLPRQIAPIICISAYKGNRFGITIETTPKAVIINHDNTAANNALFSRNANSIVNRDKDYISTVLQTQKHMLSVVLLCPDQLEDLF